MESVGVELTYDASVVSVGGEGAFPFCLAGGLVQSSLQGVQIDVDYRPSNQVVYVKISAQTNGELEEIVRQYVKVSSAVTPPSYARANGTEAYAAMAKALKEQGLVLGNLGLFDPRRWLGHKKVTLLKEGTPLESLPTD